MIWKIKNSQSEEDIKIYDINIKDKTYILLQTINLFNEYGKPIELSNGNIVTSNFCSQFIILKNNYSSNSNKIYEIQTYTKLEKRQ